MARQGNRKRPGAGKAASAVAPAKRPQPGQAGKTIDFEAVLALLFGLLALLSVAGYPEPRRWVFIAIAVSLALFAGLRRLSRSREIVVDLADAILAALIAFGALSLTWTANRNGGIQTVIVACAMFALMVYLKRCASDTVLTGIAIGVGGAALGAIATNMWLPNAQYSGFANSGYAAEALLLCIPFVWPLWRFRTVLARGFVVAVAVAVVGYIVFWTPSMIGFFVAGMFAAIVSLVYASKRGAALGRLCVAAWLIVPPLIAWVGWDQLNLTGRLFYRAELWLNAGVMAAHRPLFGHGLGSFIEVFPLHKEDVFPIYKALHIDPALVDRIHNTRFDSYVTEAEAVHNEPVQLLTELGLVGLLPFLALLALTLRAGVRRLATDPFAAAGAAAVVTVVGESLLEYPFQRAATLFLAVLAFAFAARGPDSGLRQWRLRVPTIVPVALAPVTLAAAALLVFAAIRQEGAERLLDKTRLPGSDPVQNYNLLLEAHRLDPLERRIRTALPIMLDGVIRARGLAAVPQAAIDQIYAWQEDGGHYNTAALVAHAQLLLEKDGGNDPDFPRVMEALKAGSDRVAARYAIEARYQIGHGQYAQGLATVAEGKKYRGVSDIPGADASIQANLDNLERIARNRMAQQQSSPPEK
jgi:hypothetical protein